MIDILNGEKTAEMKNKIIIIFYNGPKLSLIPAINGESYNPAEVVANGIDHMLTED